MKQKHHQIFRISIILALLLIVTVSVNPVSALKVEGAKIMLDVKPGTTYIFPMAVSIKPNDAATDVAIDVLGFGQSADGGTYSGLDAAADTSQYSARNFVSVEKPVIHLKPGERAEFKATIKVPSDAKIGGRYALILIHPASDASGQQTAFATAVAVPVMLTPDGGSLSETGEIMSVVAGNIVPGKPIRITTTLRNTGNHHYYGAVNKVTVTDASGNTVATVTTEPFAKAMIPGESVNFPADITTGLTAGAYTVTSRMEKQDGTLLDEGKTGISVKEPYIPPFEQTVVQVSPDKEAVLAVPGGAVTIGFPKGAFVADGSVTVRPATDAIPPAPAGSALGTTAFIIDGVSGLLTQDATVKVKYTSGDLAAAGGDANKLVLARYDRTDSRWTLLPTTVDTGSQMLTTTTNRMSIWAVMAAEKAPSASQAAAGSPTQSPGPEPLLLCGLVAFAMLARSARK